MNVPFAIAKRFRNSSLSRFDRRRSSPSPMWLSPNISPRTISAPVQAPHTLPFRIPLPKHDPSRNAVSSVIPHSLANANRTDCEQCIFWLKHSVALICFSVIFFFCKTAGNAVIAFFLSFYKVLSSFSITSSASANVAFLTTTLSLIFFLPFFNC